MRAIKVYIGNVQSNGAKWLKDLQFEIEGKGFEIQEPNAKLKGKSNFILYVFSNEDKNIRTIVDVVNDANHFKEKTLFCTMDSDFDQEHGFTKHQKKSIAATGKMINLNGGKWIEGLKETVDYMVKQMAIND